MSEQIGASDRSNSLSKQEPDYLGWFKEELSQLLFHRDNFLPFSSPSPEFSGDDATRYDKSLQSSSSLFTNALGVGGSDYKLAKLKGLLRTTAEVYSQQVDEMVNPVLAACHLRCQLRQKESILQGSENQNLTEDVKILLESDSSLVEKLIKKQSDEIFASLQHVDLHLEGILDSLMDNYRPMTHAEKQQLGKLIQKLSPKNLDRVAEIVQQGKPSNSNKEIFVDLEEEDNRTLWRLYYYVQAVENARACLDKIKTEQ